MSQSESVQLQQAITAIKQGDKKRGRKLLATLLERNPDIELAWLWMSVTVRGERKEYCLKQALRINSSNETALELLERQQRRTENADIISPVENFKNCPYCAEKIRSEANLCRYCGSNLTVKKTPTSPKKPIPTKKRSGIRLLLIGSVGIFTLITICICMLAFIPSSGFLASDSEPSQRPTLPPTYTPNSSRSTSENIDLIEAKVLCQELVKMQLTTPRSAEFPFVPEDRIVRLPDNEFVINSYVEAQNPFGVMIRNYYSCHLRYDDKWFLMDLTFE